MVLARDGPVLIEGNVGNPMFTYQLLAGPFLSNGVAERWKSQLECELPDGSFRWRLRHWHKGRRLTLIETVLSNLSNPLINFVLRP